MFDEDQFEVTVHGKFGVLPVRMEDGSVGYDVALPEEAGNLYLPYNSRRCIDTGIIIKPPIKCFELIVPRSSSRKKGIRISNTMGVIDPSYCGKDDTIRVDITREPKKSSFVGRFPYDFSMRRYYPKGAFHANMTYEAFGLFETWCEERGVSPFDLETVYDPETKEMHVFEEAADEYLIYSSGERFCQVLFVPYYRPDLLEAKLEELEDESRGGFGSTGA